MSAKMTVYTERLCSPFGKHVHTHSGIAARYVKPGTRGISLANCHTRLLAQLIALVAFHRTRWERCWDNRYI